VFSVANGTPEGEDAEVLDIVTVVMKDDDAGKLERRHRRRATATTDADEIIRLMAFGRNGLSAFALLQRLRADHGARCKRARPSCSSSRRRSRAR
jgi:hypothetical protein